MDLHDPEASHYPTLTVGTLTPIIVIQIDIKYVFPDDVLPPFKYYISISHEVKVSFCSEIGSDPPTLE